MPFDSREYIDHFWLIQPVGWRGGGGLLSPLAWFNQGWGVGGGGAVPFRPIQSVGGGGGGVAVRFGAVQPGGGEGGLSPFGPFNQWGGGGGCCPLSAHSISGGGGGVLSPLGPFNQCITGGGHIYVNFYNKGAIQSQKGKGGGGLWPPCPHPGDTHDWVYMLCRLCLLGVCSAGALQALPMVLM